MFRFGLVLMVLFAPHFLAAPERVVSLAPSLTSAIFELQAGASLIGATDYCSVPQTAQQVTRIGGYQDPNVEVIVHLQPDLVLALPEHKSIVETLAKLGIASLTLANTNIRDIEDTMQVLGVRLDKVAAAQAWASKIAAIKATIKAPSERMRVLLVLSHEAKQQTINQVYVAGPASFLNELLVMAGGENAISLRQPVYPKLSQEALLQMAPDRVINLVPQADLAPELRQNQMRAWLNLPHFSAARPEAILFLHHEAVLQAGPRFYEILAEMQKLLATP